MPPDPDNKMDELLKACAAKRKAEQGAPFELHPATRSLLQAEVARVFPRAAEKPAKRSFLPRFLFATAVAASIAICAVIIFHEDPAKAPVLVAKQKLPAFDPNIDTRIVLGSTDGLVIHPPTETFAGATGLPLTAMAPTDAAVTAPMMAPEGMTLAMTTRNMEALRESEAVIAGGAAPVPGSMVIADQTMANNELQPQAEERNDYASAAGKAAEFKNGVSIGNGEVAKEPNVAASGITMTVQTPVTLGNSSYRDNAGTPLTNSMNGAVINITSNGGNTYNGGYAAAGQGGTGNNYSAPAAPDLAMTSTAAAAPGGAPVLGDDASKPRGGSRTEAGKEGKESEDEPAALAKKEAQKIADQKNTDQRLQFANTAKPANKSQRGKISSADKVLVTFQIQLEGDNIRLIDSDGSTYTGRINQGGQKQIVPAAKPQTQPSKETANARSVVAKSDSKNSDTRKSAPAPAPAEAPATSTGALQITGKNSYTGSAIVTTKGGAGDGNGGGEQQQHPSQQQNQLGQNNFYFQATGTNRKLNKVVVIEGNYTADIPEDLLKAQVQQAEKLIEQSKNNAADKTQEAQENVISLDNNTNARIQGQMQVGTGASGETIDIDAVAVPEPALKAKDSQ